MIHKLILWNKITNEMKMARSTGDYFLILWKWVSCQSKGTLIYSGWLWPTLGENWILYNWYSLFSFPSRYFLHYFPIQSGMGSTESSIPEASAIAIIMLIFAFIACVCYPLWTAFSLFLFFVVWTRVVLAPYASITFSVLAIMRDNWNVNSMQLSGITSQETAAVSEPRSSFSRGSVSHWATKGSSS